MEGGIGWVEVANGEFAPSSGVLVHPHLHDMTRFACDMVSLETLEAWAVRKALFVKSMVAFGVRVRSGVGMWLP